MYWLHRLRLVFVQHAGLGPVLVNSTVQIIINCCIVGRWPLLISQDGPKRFQKERFRNQTLILSVYWLIVVFHQQIILIFIFFMDDVVGVVFCLEICLVGRQAVVHDGFQNNNWRTMNFVFNFIVEIFYSNLEFQSLKFIFI